MLKHGILGLLNYADMTGYEIRETFQNSLNFFWSAQTSQIYRELDTLTQSGWIQKQTVSQQGKPDKNICSITEAGRQELLRWLEEPMSAIAVRSPVLMKLFFMGELPVDRCLAFLQQLKAQQLAAIADLGQTDAAIPSYQTQVPEESAALFWQMTADFGKRYAQMYLGWIDHCIRLLETREE